MDQIVANVLVGWAYEDKQVGHIISQHESLEEAIEVSEQHDCWIARYTPEYCAPLNGREKSHLRALFKTSVR